MALAIFTQALEDAALLSLPIVSLIAGVGVCVGLVQTIVQVQDQNVAFAPKLAVAALIITAYGPAALALLRELLVATMSILPHLART